MVPKVLCGLAPAHLSDILSGLDPLVSRCSHPAGPQM